MKKLVALILVTFFITTNAYSGDKLSPEMIGTDTSSGITIVLDYDLYLNLWVRNDGKFPIELNSLADKYTYKSEGKIYQVTDLEEYTNKVLNPDNEYKLLTRLYSTSDYRKEHFDFIKKLYEGKIEAIYVTINYGKTIIEMKPTPHLLEKIKANKNDNQ